MSGDGPIDGSPQTENCSYTDSRRSATSPSSCEDVKSVDPVPFYLIPQALAREMQQYGDAISERYVHRTSGHVYQITLIVRGEEA